jgi:hypothetical protein
MHEKVVANDELARQYASDEKTHAISWNQRGKKIWEYSARYECTNISGLPYNHMVEENGLPLSAKRLAAEQRRQNTLSKLGLGQDFVLDVRNLDPHAGIRSALPICCLATLFDNRVLRHEQINGRDNLVIESVPKRKATPSSQEERTAFDWKETTWIDAGDLIPARYEVELLHDKGPLLKGSQFRRGFFRLEEASKTKDESSKTVWLQSDSGGHFNIKFYWYRQLETWEDTSYNFKKFKADAFFLDDSTREAAQKGPSQNP